MEKKITKRSAEDRILGSLVCGALGDALGYPVEFMDLDMIHEVFGENGIRELYLFDGEEKAVISDDTQMTIFTREALGIIKQLENRGLLTRDRIWYIKERYLDWFRTQQKRFDEFRYVGLDREPLTVLVNEPRLIKRRAPGRTCLDSLYEIISKDIDVEDYISLVRNDSKGCGGVMRIAPVALYRRPRNEDDLEDLDMLAAQAAAVTHTHPLGFITAAMLVHIISSIVYPMKEQTLEEIVSDAKDRMLRMFRGYEDTQYLAELTDLAVTLSLNDKDDIDNLILLGEGWVAEETLAIAIYCALRYRNDPVKGLIAAVNHDGDTDSTGAVTGNILGALCGFSSLPEDWVRKLELMDVLKKEATGLFE